MLGYTHSAQNSSFYIFQIFRAVSSDPTKKQNAHFGFQDIEQKLQTQKYI